MNKTPPSLNELDDKKFHDGENFSRINEKCVLWGIDLK